MAEKKKGFSITEYVTPEDVSNLDTQPTATMQIIEVPIYSIQVNELNFYDTSNVDELVKSIALNGLLEPIIVMPAEPIPGATGPAYRIISGHRRFSAWLTLAAEDPKKYAAIPAIVKTPANEIMEELLLIEANRATRVMSSADTAKQAERYMDLLSKLKESGVEIPGRLRDVVAEAMGVSASRLARLAVIRKNLCEEAMSLFEKSAMNESVAYELAQASIEAQKKIFASSKNPEKMPAWQIEKKIKWIATLENICCGANAKCANRDRMFAEACKESNSYSYLQCTSAGKCCKDCSKLYTCSSACSQYADKIKKHKAKEKEERASEKSEAETKKLNQITENNKQWQREAYARKKSGVTIEEARKAMREIQCYSIPADSIMKDFENGNCDDSWAANLLYGLRAYELAALANLYNCSADYLIGLSEDLTRGAAPSGWRDYPSHSPQDGQRIITLKRQPTRELRVGQAIYREGKLLSDQKGFDTVDVPDGLVIGWMPFPEGS